MAQVTMRELLQAATLIKGEHIEDSRDGRVVRLLLDELHRSPIAIETAAANEQHYEVPTRFFELCLGRRLKYSSCFYPTGRESLDEAIARLAAPRVAWVMLPAGEITDTTINHLSATLAPGDLVVDGGNANYLDSQRRGAMLAARGIGFADLSMPS